MKNKKIFLISPVRNVTEEEMKQIYEYVEKLEKQGHKVHWPHRDTNQVDPIGLRICTDNARAIVRADEIHIWWSEKSQGSLFDFGMSFMLYILGSKKIILANPDEVKPTEKKSFNNVLLTLHKKNAEERKKRIVIPQDKKFIFVCCPLRGKTREETEENIRKAKEYSRQIALEGNIPLSPVIYFPQFLNDEERIERGIGLAYSKEWLKISDEMRIYEPEKIKDHEGMQEELRFAKEFQKQGIDIKITLMEVEDKQ